MKWMFLLYTNLFMVASLIADDSMESLINMYKNESKLSNITKRESAGYLELYTRDELEKMQAHNLLDVLKVVPSLILSKNEIGINGLSPLGGGTLPDASIRLYVNDHEMTSASYGSAFLVWADIPLEYIDHIEIYKVTSSIEFGNEVASLIVRVYTKKAEREEGSKIRLMASANGGYDTNIYNAHQLENGFSYFAYANKDTIKSDRYYNYRKGKRYTIKDDKKSYTLFANLAYKEWNVDIGSYAKKTDAYIGAGYFHTPSGKGIDTLQTYIHVEKKFAQNIKLQLSYDYINNDGIFRDENYIPITDGSSPGTKAVTPNIPPETWIVQDYEVYLHDTISSLILEKRFIAEKNNLLVGAFIKHKTFEDSAKLRSNVSHTPLGFTPYVVDINNENNSLNLYSLYFEENYYFDTNTQFVVSMKGDFYRYKKNIPNKDELIARVGAIKNISKLQIKAFASHLYTPATFLQLYSTREVPQKPNPRLKYPTQDLYTGSVRYKEKAQSIELSFSTTKIKNAIYYDMQNGYENKQTNNRYSIYQLSYKYLWNIGNKIYLDYSYGVTHGQVRINPNQMLLARIFNQYKKFDFYQELKYENSYDYFNTHLHASYGYTSAVKYHWNEDISIGFRGDNIFNTGYKEAYKRFNMTFPISEQRFWLNFEVVF